MWRLIVGEECVGSGMCVGIASHLFRLDPSEHSRAVVDLVQPDQGALDAAMSCPMEAIRIVDAETGADVVEATQPVPNGEPRLDIGSTSGPDEEARHARPR